MLFGRYSPIFVLVWFFSDEIQVGVDGRKRPPPGRLQTKYNSTDPAVQQFLKFANVSLIFDIEEAFFLRISSTKYIMSIYPMNWFKAYQICRVKGGYLIDSVQQFKEVSSYFGKIDWPGCSKFWIGATCTTRDGIFRWFNTAADLEANDFSWAPGEPSSVTESCIVADKIDRSYFMKSVNCETKALALCNILEANKPIQTGTVTRKKKKTIRMHSLFS